jgi:peptide/nickel transport system permease protein
MGRVKPVISETKELSGNQRTYPRTQWALFWRKFRKITLAKAGAVTLLVIGFCAIFAPYLGLPSITEMDLGQSAAPPTWSHPLGTDSYGRDMLARLVHGARVSLAVGLSSVGLSLLAGIPLGLLAGYFKGKLDSILMRLMDAVFSFPPILLAIALVAILGPSAGTVVIALSVVYTPRFARVVRSSTLAESELEYVMSARAIGASHWRIMFIQILPNVVGPITVQATVTFAYAIITEASLSFLGLGVQPPSPSWGLMLNEARMYIEDAPYYPIFPGLAIVIAVLAINLLGDGLRDALDPRQNRGE